jgi:hypothetical protein
MKPSLVLTFAAAFCASACTKGAESNEQPARAIEGLLWPKKEDALVSTLQKRQNANLVRLAQQRAIQAAAERAAAELAAAERAYKRKSSRARRVPPSMYRTTEPPLPEPDLSLPIQEIPRSSPP